MSALEDEQHLWYIEELSVEDNAQVVESAGVHSASSFTPDEEKTDAAATFTPVDVSSAELDSAQCKIADVVPSQHVQPPSASLLRTSWACKTIDSSSSRHPPTPRGGCSWTKVGSKYVLFGGADAFQKHFDDVYCFDPETGTWEKAGECTRTPVGREMHSACIYDSKTTGDGSSTILVMGGRSAEGVLRDLFSLCTDSWSWIKLKDAPSPRCAHSASFIEGAGIMAIHGGWDGGVTVANDLHLYDVNSGEWMMPRVSPLPSGRFAHAACAWGDTSLLVYGGVNPEENLTDVVVLTAC